MGARLGEREALLRALPLNSTPTRVGAGSGPVVTVLRIILGDQLSLDLPALDDLDAGSDTVLMMEVMEENTHVMHHKQKIVLVLSAMRHFAQTSPAALGHQRLDGARVEGGFHEHRRHPALYHECCNVPDVADAGLGLRADAFDGFAGLDSVGVGVVFEGFMSGRSGCQRARGTLPAGLSAAGWTTAAVAVRMAVCRASLIRTG
jgi:hypothetical protein